MKMRAMPDREKVIKGLECCDCYNVAHGPLCGKCPYKDECEVDALKLIHDVHTLLKTQNAFMEYFVGLYGQGLEVANWHLNGAMEPLDNFIDSAMEGFEDA